MRFLPTRSHRHFIQAILYVELVAKPGVACFPSFDLVPFAQLRDKPVFYMAFDAD
jgi:hypothetical protein